MRQKQMSTSRFVAHFSVSFSFYSVSHYSAPPRFGWQSAHMTIKPGLLIRHVSQNNKSVCRVFNPLLESTAKNSPQLNITQSTYVTSFFFSFFFYLPPRCVRLACSGAEYSLRCNTGCSGRPAGTLANVPLFFTLCRSVHSSNAIKVIHLNDYLLKFQDFERLCVTHVDATLQ